MAYFVGKDGVKTYYTGVDFSVFNGSWFCGDCYDDVR